MREKWIPVDLARFPPGVSLVVDAEEDTKIGVIVTRNGEPVNLTGSLSARMILPDGSMLSQNGTVDGNVGYVVLPDDVYENLGVVVISMRHADGSDVVTLCTVAMTVKEVGA